MRALTAACVAGLVLFLTPGRAHAAWLQATSDHFVIYADESERQIREFSEHLERFQSALSAVTGYDAPVPSPSNRVIVYVVANDAAVKKLYGEGSRFVGGFYLPRAGGSIAIVPESSEMFGVGDSALTILLHEYTHHFFISASSQALPRWMTEGAAEFFSAASFEKDGGMKVGRPAASRGYELLFGRDVTATDLLDPAEYEKRRSKGYDAFYGKSWLLYHYLTFEPVRQGQLRRYIDLLAKGGEQRKAAQDAFGDFAQLEKDLDAYLQRRRMHVLSIAPAGLKTGPIAVRQLGAGEAAAMPVRIRSDRGVNQESAGAVVALARSVAARFPKDPAVLSVLAEAEHDAGNDKAAVAAADAALAIDPAQTNAYIQKGLSLFRLAMDAPDKAVAYKEAMKPFTQLNKLEKDHPLPLLFYYRSFIEQDRKPSPLAISGLRRASELAPFDLGLRMTLAVALLKDGKRDEARDALAPIAYNPHGGGFAAAARRVMDRLDKEPGWTGSDVEATLANGEVPAEKE